MIVCNASSSVVDLMVISLMTINYAGVVIPSALRRIVVESQLFRRLHEVLSWWASSLSSNRPTHTRLHMLVLVDIKQNCNLDEADNKNYGCVKSSQELSC